MPGREPTRRLAASVLLAVVACLLALVVFELGLQVYSQLVLYPKLDSLRANDRHFLVKSDDPVLGYEMEPGFQMVLSDGEELAINRYGLRESSDDLFEGRRKLALLGDSVVMSFRISQEETMDNVLESSLLRAGDDTAVLNFGVGGYAFPELLRFLEVKNETYQVDHVLFVLNANDYAQRDTIYEGADNGTFRLYHRPLLKTRWFVGKAIYRYKKGSSPFASVDWYRWLYEGNEDLGRETLDAMDAYCERAGCGFSVVLYPAAVAYTEDGYALQDMYDELGSWLERRGIPYISPVDAFASDPQRYFDETDHFKDEGNELFARILHDFLAEQGVVKPRRR